MTDLNWQRTSPFGVLFFFTSAIKRLTGGVMQMAASAGVVVVALRSDGLGWAVLAVVLVLVLLLATAILRYWFFRFASDGDGLRIRQGVFRKTQLEIRFDRVQGMDVEQSLVDRLLGLATVTFETAGSTAREGQLPAIPRSFADTLRERFEQRRHQVAAPAPDGEAPPLLKLGASDMVRIGFTSRNVLVGLAILPVLFQALAEVTEGLAKRAVTAAAEELLALGLWVGVLVVAVLVIAGVTLLALLTVASAFLRFHDFELRQDGSAFRSRAGLLTRKEVVVERAKIQQVSVAQGLIMVRMGCCRLKMLPATSGAPSGNNAPVGAQTLQAPLVGVPELADLRARIFGEEGMRLSLRPDNAGFTAISPLYIRARLLSVGVLPALVATAALVPAFGLVGLLALAWPLPVLLAAWQAWRRRGYLFDDDGLVSRRGLLGYSVDAFLFRKAQGATVRRSPLQRRKGLASLTVHLASGDLTVPYLDFATACRLRDYMLFKVESSRRRWH